MVSAIVAYGPPARLIDRAAKGEIELVLCEPVLDELDRALRQKLGFSEKHAGQARSQLLELASECIARQPEVEKVTGYSADDEIIACAVHAQVEVLVTGDRRHLLPIEEHKGVRVVTPQALLAELAS